MWWGFGIVAFVIVGALRAHWLLNGFWFAKKRRTPEGKLYYWKHSKGRRGRNPSSFFGIPAKPGCYFKIRREGRFDRFFKWLGLSHEIQTGDAHFDKQYYLIADDEHLARKLMEGAARNNGVFFALKRFMPWVEHVTVTRNCIWGQLTEPVPDVSGAQATQFMEYLSHIEENTKEQTISWQQRRSSKAFWRAMLFSMLNTGMVLGAGMYGVVFSGATRLVDGGPLYWDAFMTALLLTAASVSLAVIMLGRTSRAHLVVLDCLTVGLMGWWLAGAAMMAAVNYEYDRSEARDFSLQIIEHYVREGGKSRTTYHFVTRHWEKPHRNYTFSVTGSEYYNYSDGCMFVRVRAGALGYQWFEEEKVDYFCRMARRSWYR